MKKVIFSTIIICAALFAACEKNNDTNESSGNCPDNPRTNISAALTGKWMYGFFSMTEYWNQNPADYIGNGFEFAIAFKFNSDGTFEQYFTSSTVSLGVRTYQQSVSKGTVVLNEANKTFKTYTCSAHYKRTKNNQTVEERDLEKSELSAPTSYTYTLSTEPNGTKAINLTLQGTTSPLKFLQKQ